MQPVVKLLSTAVALVGVSAVSGVALFSGHQVLASGVKLPEPVLLQTQQPDAALQTSVRPDLGFEAKAAHTVVKIAAPAKLIPQAVAPAAVVPAALEVQPIMTPEAVAPKPRTLAPYVSLRPPAVIPSYGLRHESGEAVALNSSSGTPLPKPVLKASHRKVPASVKTAPRQPERLAAQQQKARKSLFLPYMIGVAR